MSATATGTPLAGQVIQVKSYYQWKNALVLESYQTSFRVLNPKGEQETHNIEDENESWRLL
jgi:hypothetical protein